MLIECALALISLSAVSFIWNEYASGEIVTPTQVFATGISRMVASIPGLAGAQSTISSLLVLTVSVFCLTSLDTAREVLRVFANKGKNDGYHHVAALQDYDME